MAGITYSRDNPSSRFRELERVYSEIHRSGLPNIGITPESLFTGKSLLDHIPRVRALVQASGAKSILDYGSGKGLLYAQRDLRMGDGSKVASVKEYWDVSEIKCFDPGVPEFSEYPSSPADGVVCTDVLEHIPEEDVPWFLSELFRLANRFVFANIASYPAKKSLPNGWNAHVTVRPPKWWEKQVRLAAQSWRGEMYDFRITEKKSGIVGAFRKLSGSGKLKITSVEAGTAAVLGPNFRQGRAGSNARHDAKRTQRTTGEPA